MDATPRPDDPPLPTDVPTLQGMVRDRTARNRFLEGRVVELEATVARLEAKVAELQAKLDAPLKHRFGRRSERRKPTPRPPGAPPRRDEHGRSPLPPHLERRDTVHDLADADKPCPHCGTVRPCIGEQVTEQLDLEPATVFVRRTVKRSDACRTCDPATVPADERIRTAGPPQVGPIANGLCRPGLLAHAVTAKFADHTPVHRRAGQLARSGVTVARSPPTDWRGGAADPRTPLCQLMAKRRLLSRVVHADDTPVNLRLPKAPKTKASHLWVAIGDADVPYVALDFTADHSAAGPTAFFRGFQGVFAGRRPGPVRDPVRRRPGDACLLCRPRPPHVRGRRRRRGRAGERRRRVVRPTACHRATPAAAVAAVRRPGRANGP